MNKNMNLLSRSNRHLQFAECLADYCRKAVAVVVVAYCDYSPHHRDCYCGPLAVSILLVDAVD